MTKERLPFKESFPVVTCTSSRSFNLAFRITRVGFLELQNESAMTLACIEKFRDSGFEEIFMPRIDCPVKYDHVIRGRVQFMYGDFASMMNVGECISRRFIMFLVMG